LGAAGPACAQSHPAHETRVVVENEGWRLVGDLVVPPSRAPVPAVLLLNKAAGNRTAYVGLARRLAERGIASLRLDLRGHGESTNLGQFVPYAEPRSALIWDAESDVRAAHRFLARYEGIDSTRLGVVGGSYSGEEMAEAGRRWGYARAYVALSPGSFSDASIDAIDPSGIPWLVVASTDERHLHEVMAALQARSRSAEILFVPGTWHASEIVESRPDVAERVAVWLAAHLTK
jgi:dienelactone hydrolase